MKRVRVELGARSYDVLIESGLLERAAEQLLRLEIPRRVFIVSNPTVFPLYGRRLADSLQEEFEVESIEIPDGEEHKNLQSAQQIWTRLIQAGADRNCTVLALGGGVVGDVAGFAASAYLRGVTCIQMPTTLLAQVDSSVGGKTGVNHALGKNLIGAFHQPSLVLIDPVTLGTLPPRDLRSGIYETLKYGLIRDADFWTDLESGLEALRALDPAALEDAVARSCRIKADITSRDERESDLRRILNFGHTFAHALEAATEYRSFTHGEAVGEGMKAACRLSQMLGKLGDEDCRRATQLIDRVGERPTVDVPFDRLYRAMRQDKKRSKGRLKFVVLEGIGDASVVDEPGREILRQAWGS